MLQILALLMKLPAILTIILEIVKLIEAAFPRASGAQKLEAAVTTVKEIVPDVVKVASDPAVASVVNFVVGILNKPGGVFAEAKSDRDKAYTLGG